MAIRYSGDVEVRMAYGGPAYGGIASGFDPKEQGFYYATIAAPHVRKTVILSLREVGLSKNLSRKQATNPESYDTAALAILKWIEHHEGKLPLDIDDRDRIVIERVFKSPCPV